MFPEKPAAGDRPARPDIPHRRSSGDQKSPAPEPSGAFVTGETTPVSKAPTNGAPVQNERAGSQAGNGASVESGPRPHFAPDSENRADEAEANLPADQLTAQLGSVMAGDYRANPLAGAYLPSFEETAAQEAAARATVLRPGQRPSIPPIGLEAILAALQTLEPLAPGPGGEPVIPQPQPEELADLERLLQSLAYRIKREEYLLVLRAWALASFAHREQRRESGESYMRHPIAVTQILDGLGMDPVCLAAGMLHDVAEDTVFTIDYLRANFGNEIATLVDSVTKLKRIKDMGASSVGATDHKAESLRKMFIAMVDDVRVVLIKLADRLHNMRTLGSQESSKRRRIARETQDLFAPLANRLGIWTIKSELEDLSFRYLEPAVYRDLMRAVLQKEVERKRTLIIAKDELERELAAAGITAEVSSRPKHLYSIHRKMQRKGVSFDQIYDVLALRVVVENETNCYAALGIVHGTWRPIPGEFDDYIANPKNNLYRSLHTSVHGHRNGKPMEIQIRTREMHREADLGIAAHWQYKEQAGSDQYMNDKITVMRTWMRQVMEWRNDVTDPVEFVDSMKTDVLNEHVFVFTPQGDIMDLPKGSTPIDFAYAIHTELGHRCRGASINGKLQQLDYKLKNSDTVEIITAKRGGPSRDWLNPSLEYLATQRARSKVRAWLRKQNRDENIQRGRQSLERELRRLSSTISFEDMGRLFGIDKVDDFLAAIGFGDINSQHIAQKLLEQEARERNRAQQDGDPFEGLATGGSKRSERTGSDLRVMGVDGLMTSLAKCCTPVPGDDIVGYVTRGRGISIHRRGCPNMVTSLRKGGEARLIDVQWTSTNDVTYPVQIEVRAYDRQGLVRDLAALVADERINMREVKALTGDESQLAVFSATLEITDAAQLIRILTKMEHLPFVIDAYRVLDKKPKRSGSGAVQHTTQSKSRAH